MRNIITLIAFLISSVGALAQTEFKIVTKTIEESMDWKDGVEVNIEGEKAEIVVESWEKPEIKVIIELISKHPDRAQAEKDVEAMVHKIERHGNKIYFRNFIKKDIDKPESSLTAIYTVYLPKETPVYLKNVYGKSTVSNLSKFLVLNSEFSKIFLNDIIGKVDITSRFGDVEGVGLSGNVNMTTRRSDITLSDISGDFNIKSQYGILKFFTETNKSDLSLNIDAERSDVYFFDPNPSMNGYTLTAHYGNITVPSDLKFNFLENSKTIKKAVFLPSTEMASISIKISFGDIIVRNP